VAYRPPHSKNPSHDLRKSTLLLIPISAAPSLVLQFRPYWDSYPLRSRVEAGVAHRGGAEALPPSRFAREMRLEAEHDGRALRTLSALWPVVAVGLVYKKFSVCFGYFDASHQTVPRIRRRRRVVTNGGTTLTQCHTDGKDRNFGETEASQGWHILVLKVGARKPGVILYATCKDGLISIAVHLRKASAIMSKPDGPDGLARRNGNYFRMSNMLPEFDRDINSGTDC
jgi:hypothetical protein